MFALMAQTHIDELTKNVLYALRTAKVTQATVASELGIGTRTFSRRLDAGKFTFADLVAIAEATDVSLFDIIPTQDAA